MIFPSEEQLENRVREFFREIPRPSLPSRLQGESARLVQDSPRTLLTGSGIQIPPRISPLAPAQLSPSVGRFSFQLQIKNIGLTRYLQVRDGRVNGVLLAEVLFGLAAGETTVWLIIQYNTDTFEVISTALTINSDDQTSLGAQYIFIGGVTTSYNQDGSLHIDDLYNAQCGDVNFTFDFGGLNGKPAVKLTPYGDWLELPEA